MAAAIDDNKTTAWAIDGQVGKDQAASFELETPVNNAQGTTLTFILKFENNTGHNLGRLRLAISTAAKPVGLDGDQMPEKTVEDVEQALRTPAAERRRSSANGPTATGIARHDADWQKLNGRGRPSTPSRSPSPQLTKVLIASEGLPAVRLHTQGADFFEKTYYLKRGDLNQKLARSRARASCKCSITRRDGRDALADRRRRPGCRTSYRRRALAEWITDDRARRRATCWRG